MPFRALIPLFLLFYFTHCLLCARRLPPHIRLRTHCTCRAAVRIHTHTCFWTHTHHTFAFALHIALFTFPSPFYPFAPFAPCTHTHATYTHLPYLSLVWHLITIIMIMAMTWMMNSGVNPLPLFILPFPLMEWLAAFETWRRMALLFC